MSLREFGFQYQGIVYRGHNPRWQHAPASGEGAARNGGRWNPAGLPALYTSERFETAWLEAQQGFPFKTQPLTLCSYEVDCGPILDLCDSAIQARVRAHPATWIQEAWLDKKIRRDPVIAWEIAERLINMGFTGIRVPSQAKGATNRDVNIVFWKWSHQVPTKVCVIDDEKRLPDAPQ
ncbi:MAG: RES family NAD+ phosphorylase [Halomonadaceae bacterium]|uniref:RES family NAD+ phosphorylase n=1 Tax=Halomonas TaxID=2745 RepID=UPI00298EE7D8|nr:RES domain-containing protein [Halomonas colorata]